MKHYRAHLFVFCALAAALLLGWHQALHNAQLDKRFQVLSRDASNKVAVVAIDSPSIEAIGVWPWPRRVHADILRVLDKAGVTDIVFDVDFSSASNPDDDRAFEQALRDSHGSVILPIFKQVTQNSARERDLFINRPLPQFAKDSWAATVNVVADADGRVRRYSFGESLDGSFYPSLASLLSGVHKTNRVAFIPDFGIRSATIPQFSYTDVLNGRISASELSGKKIIIGGTAVELGDRFNVPKNEIMAGPVLQALATESLLQARTLQHTGRTATTVGMLVLAFAMLILWRFTSVSTRVLALVAISVAIEIAAILIQAHYPILLVTSVWQLSIVAYLVATALDEMDIRGLLAAISDRKFHRITMSVGDGLICTDENGIINFANSAAERMFDFAPGSMVGLPWSRLRPDENGGCGSGALLSAIAGETLELEATRSEGSNFIIEASISSWSGVQGVQYGIAIRDITARKQEEEKLRYLAAYDTLTDLANRNTLREFLDRTLQSAHENLEFALVLVGINRFKEINDTLGHDYGDRLLRAFADNLKANVSHASLLARFGGDVFAVVISGENAIHEARSAADLYCNPKGIALDIEGRKFCVGSTAGAAVYPSDCDGAEQLLANADLALYRAKAAREHFMFFDQSIRTELEDRLALEAELATAIDENQFVLFYQPQIDLRTGDIAGVEALIRWQHPQRGLVSPAEFLPVLNGSAMSDQVANWVVRTACRQSSDWLRLGHRVRVGVNLSPSLVQSGDLTKTIKLVLSETGLPADLLELEVTEDILLSDAERFREMFTEIRDLGVHISFDDFGTGYASLSYLKNFPLDRLKIDRSFVRNLMTDPSDAAIVDSTIKLGSRLGLSITAEGVEDSSTADLLARMGCDEAQGYHFGRPLPAKMVEKYFIHRHERVLAAG